MITERPEDLRRGRLEAVSVRNYPRDRMLDRKPRFRLLSRLELGSELFVRLFKFGRTCEDTCFEVRVRAVQVDIRPFQQPLLAFYFLVLAKELGEEKYLRFKDLRLERLCQVIDRA